jgi:AraC-like DNA-binding protein
MVLEESDTQVPDFGNEKGILHPQEQAKHRTLDRLRPGPRVGRFVEWYWVVRWDLRGQPSYVAEVLPHPSVNVTFEVSETRTGAFVNGVCTKKFTRELTGEGWTFGVKFWAGGFGAVTGINVGSFRDDVLPLSEVFDDADRLTDLVMSASDDVRRRAVVEAFLSERLVQGESYDDPSYQLVLRIVSAIVTDRELTRVDQLTERFGVPVRTLQRLFRRYVGVGPKWVLRRYRLHDGADLLARGRTEELAALAVELGYFDQAHFSREFSEEVGMTPLEYAAACAKADSHVPAYAR